jgi:phospholipase C
MALADIDHIVVLMQENRSFDHVLGYLALGNPPAPVDGIGDQAWADRHANGFGGVLHRSHPLPAALQALDDPRHGYGAIATQIDTPSAGGVPMGGFVESYATQPHDTPKPQHRDRVMGYYEADGVPTYDFLARNFVVCDRWFSALPAGTQANKLLALGAVPDRLGNRIQIPRQPLVYDWLHDLGKDNWCVYQWGALSFACLVEGWLGKVARSLILSDYGVDDQPFRHFKRFEKEWRSSKTLPPVIFLEPEYSGTPQSDDPNDDHAPTGMARGQAFVAEIYNALISNPARWARTVFIITYDEHGGFFDHVPPPAAPQIQIEAETIRRLGVRVPALVVSPLVQPGQVCSDVFDHTAILELIAEKFGKPQYSALTAARRDMLGGRLSTLLGAPSDRRPTMPKTETVTLSALQAHAPPPEVATADPGAREAYEDAAARMLANYPEITRVYGFRDA